MNQEVAGSWPARHPKVFIGSRGCLGWPSPLQGEAQQSSNLWRSTRVYLGVGEWHNPSALGAEDRRFKSCLVGSSTGAVARRLILGLYPGFPPSCPCRTCRGPVSSARHIARSVRISRTTRSCTVRRKAYETCRSAFALRYSLRLRSCRLIGAFIISPCLCASRKLG